MNIVIRADRTSTSMGTAVQQTNGLHLRAVNQALTYVRGKMDIGASNKPGTGMIAKTLCAGGTFNKGELCQRADEDLARIQHPGWKDVLESSADWAKDYGCGNCEKKVDHYTPRIKDGLPPARVKTSYPAKMVDGTLQLAAAQIKHGQYVEIPSGSVAKFKTLVELRGLKIVRHRQQEDMTIVYVVTPEWLADNPEVKAR